MSKCGYCGGEILNGDGERHFGTFTAHLEYRCQETFKARIARLEAALTLLTNGFKYSTEVVTIAREALATSETKGDPNV